MESNLSLFGPSSLGGGGRVSDPICTMSRYLPFLGFDGAPKLYEVSYLQTDRANTRGPSGPKNVIFSD